MDLAQQHALGARARDALAKRDTGRFSSARIDVEYLRPQWLGNSKSVHVAILSLANTTCMKLTSVCVFASHCCTCHENQSSGSC